MEHRGRPKEAPQEIKEKYVQLFKKYNDVFAWKY